jgi:hypothetical protein
MTAHVNQMNRTRPSYWSKGKGLYPDPYLRFEAAGWTWDVLRSYQGDNGKEFARWFTEVRSPYTMGSGDLGDTYVAEIVANGVLVYADPSIDLDALQQQVKLRISPQLRRAL